MSLLTKITATKNLDVSTKLVNKIEDTVQVEASITQFIQENGTARVLKKVTVSGVDKTFLKAQDSALSKAVELLGL